MAGNFNIKTVITGHAIRPARTVIQIAWGGKRLKGTRRTLTALKMLFLARSQSAIIVRIMGKKRIIAESVIVKIKAVIADIADAVIVIIFLIRIVIAVIFAGAFAGAYHGESGLPDRWVSDVEFRTGLTGVADDVLSLTGLGPSPAPIQNAAADEYDPIVVDDRRWITLVHSDSAALQPDEAHDIRLMPHPTAARELVR